MLKQKYVAGNYSYALQTNKQSINLFSMNLMCFSFLKSHSYLKELHLSAFCCQSSLRYQTYMLCEI